jgi:hypothetical protein
VGTTESGHRIDRTESERNRSPWVLSSSLILPGSISENPYQYSLLRLAVHLLSVGMMDTALLGIGLIGIEVSVLLDRWLGLGLRL